MKLKQVTAFCTCLAIALFLSACSSEKENTIVEERNDENDGQSEVDADVQQAMVEFEQEVASLIEQYDDDFQRFANAVESESKEFSEEELQEMKAVAAESSEELANELENLEIPPELEAYSEELDQSLTNLAEDLKERSERLSTKDVDQALKEAKAVSKNVYDDFEQGLSSIYESLGLQKPEFLTDNQ